MSTSPYEPKYVANVDDVPITGPDPFTQSEKLRAIRDAESRLEADVNDGYPIENPEHSHSYAVEAYASYQLALGPKEPGSQNAGHFADEGSQRTEFIDHLLTIYKDLVASIQRAGGDESGGGSGDGTGGGSDWDSDTYGFEVM